MLNWDINSMVLKQEEMIKEAEHEHLAQEVIDETRKVNPRYNPTLAWVGRRMMDVGIKLVEMTGNNDDKQSAAEIHLN